MPSILDLGPFVIVCTSAEVVKMVSTVYAGATAKNTSRELVESGLSGRPLFTVKTVMCVGLSVPILSGYLETRHYISRNSINDLVIGAHAITGLVGVMSIGVWWAEWCGCASRGERGNCRLAQYVMLTGCMPVIIKPTPHSCG
ncbi:hypothetical protein ACTXT7_007501 [Hymenolepis weldensis]